MSIPRQTALSANLSRLRPLLPPSCRLDQEAQTYRSPVPARHRQGIVFVPASTFPPGFLAFPGYKPIPRWRSSWSMPRQRWRATVQEQLPGWQNLSCSNRGQRDAVYSRCGERFSATQSPDAEPLRHPCDHPMLLPFPTVEVHPWIWLCQTPGFQKLCIVQLWNSYRS